MRANWPHENGPFPLRNHRVSRAMKLTGLMRGVEATLLGFNLYLQLFCSGLGGRRQQEEKERYTTKMSEADGRTGFLTHGNPVENP
uniref:Transposase n=1 Tax=Steinernema glaseri TaxID=37863 RepID=A0A1I7Z6Y4_9BILA